MQKGTLELLNVWSQNPDWPLLEIVSRDRSLARYTAANIRFHFDFMTEDALATLMNQCGIHICASTVEGFGHSINESMSCGAAVITTDGAPMNELVSTGQGVLVPVSGAIPVGWAQAFQVEAHALSAAITGVLNMDIERLAQMGHGARAQYLRSQESFHHNVKKLFTETRLG
jgi:glycosyltransferase involved in cell wall biosynthesis